MWAPFKVFSIKIFLLFPLSSDEFGLDLQIVQAPPKLHFPTPTIFVIFQTQEVTYSEGYHHGTLRADDAFLFPT